MKYLKYEILYGKTTALGLGLTEGDGLKEAFIAARVRVVSLTCWRGVCFEQLPLRRSRLYNFPVLLTSTGILKIMK